MDIKRKCFCNDNRGTDCDYCGGTGWITDKITLGSPPPKKEPTQIPRSKPVKKKNIPKHGKKLKVKPVKKTSKSIEERIRELTDAFKQLQVDAMEDTINNLGEELKELYFDIKAFKPKLKKTQIKIYDNCLRRSIALIHSFDNKFEKYRLLE